MSPPRAALLAAAAAAAAAAASKRPNIVFVLADDLNNDWKQDRLSLMPNLRALAARGSHFVHHAAVQPVCGPSRSSFLSGRYPHNTGYVCNSDAPSTEKYKRIHNNSVGTWLTAAGYHTAFVGKYVNVSRCPALKSCAHDPAPNPAPKLPALWHALETTEPRALLSERLEFLGGIFFV